MSSTPPDTPRLHPYLVLGLGLLAASAASIFIRYAQEAGAPSLVIAAYRLSLAALVLLPVMVWRHRTEIRRLTAREWAAVAVAGVFLGLHFGTWITSLAYTTVANSVVLVSTAPLFAALIAGLVLREKLGRMVWPGLGLALLGSGAVALSDVCHVESGCPPVSDFLRGEGLFGDGLALVGGAAMAVYLSVGRGLRAGMPLLVYIGLTYGAAAITLLLGLAASGQVFSPPLPALPWIVLLALIPQLIGHSSLNWALKYLPATFVAVTVLGEPIGSAALAGMLFGEIPTPLKLLGGALILLGILIASQRRSES
jgi:drug/metabolite transporter (DMT)-like permease